MCLLADLSLEPSCLSDPAGSHRSHRTPLARAVAPRDCPNVYDLYRDNSSNPMAAVLARGVASLSLRASLNAQPVKHPDPSVANSCAVSLATVVKPAFRDPPDQRRRRTEPCSGVPGDATVSGRFRNRKSSRFRTIIQVIFCPENGVCTVRADAMQPHHDTTVAPSARAMPAKSLRAALTVNPAAVNSALTADSWPAPNSTINRPPGASRRRASAAMAR
jgi:hypothetical protein